MATYTAVVPGTRVGADTEPLSGGEAVPLTLDFAHAGSVTLDVPVEAQSYYFSSYSPPPVP